MLARRLVALVVAVVFSSASPAWAGAADFFIAPDKSVYFGLNVPTDSNDIYFSLSGPDSRSWIAVGMGSRKMDKSFMIIAYRGSNGNNITISPRLSSGHTEPVWTSKATIEVLPGTGVFNGSIVANGRCVNCRSWDGGSLDVKSTTQDMIFATGPSGDINSDSLAADTTIHNSYGTFIMNMTKATGDGGVPGISNVMSGAWQLSSGTNSDYWPALHGAIMIFTFVILMPLGLVLLRVVESVRWHAINQTLAAILAIIGGAIGIYLGLMYNRLKSFNTAHEVLGIVVVVAVIVQFLLGYMHHRIYKKTQTTTKMAPIHVWLGRVVIIAAIVDGFLGFPLAFHPKYNWVMAVLVALVGVGLAGLIFVTRRRSGQKSKLAAMSAGNWPGSQHQGYVQAPSTNQSDIHLGQMGTSYGR